MRTVLVLLSLLLSAAAAARPAPRVLKKLSLEQRTEAPTFYHGSALEPMDRDRLLYLGSGMWQEQEVFYLLRLRDLQTLTVRAPLAAYLDRFPEVLGRDKRPTHRYFQIQRLLFYDRDTAAAAVEASDDAGAREVTRHFYFHWDLKKGAFTEATLVARTRGRGSYTNPITVGYDPGRRTFYYVRDVVHTRGRAPASADAKQPSRKVTVVAFDQGKARVLTRFPTALPLARRAYFDGPRRRALLVEYAERGMGVEPRGHLVQLDSGRVKSFTIPVVTYGAAFARDGSRLYLYSSQTGMLWAVDPATGKALQRIKVGGLGHELARWSGDDLLLLRNAGLQLVRPGKRLRKGPFVPVRRIYTGFSHVQGSRVLGQRVFVKNGTDLHVVTLEPKGR
jgi:hypothetical protein